jgi:putative hydrolase of the HAD superfamily
MPDAPSEPADAPPTAGTVAAVLWDCDGVLQHGIHGALAELAALVGPDALPRLLVEEQPALRGEESLRSAVGRVIAALGLAVTVDEVLPIWDRYELDGAALEVLATVRAAGYPCYLATNQQDYRRDRMRSVSGYDDLVDGSFYSCEMGVAKPDPGFFRRIVTDLAQPANALLFVDDNAENVAAARGMGLRAERVDAGDVAPQLLSIFARHRLDLRRAGHAGR